MPILEAAGVSSLLGSAAHPLLGGPDEFDPLLDAIGDARFVLLGEASHGTHEFCRARADITRRLIVEKGFRGVAVDADWADAWRVDRWLRGASGEADAAGALAGLRRFAAWTWRNADVVDFLGWLREHDYAIADDEDKAGFWGLDLYSLNASMETVISPL